MQKLTAFCLLALLVGCGSENNDGDEKEANANNASFRLALSSPITPVSWVATRQEESKQEETKQEEAAEAEAAEAEETIESVIAEFDEAMSEFMTTYRAAKTDEERRELFQKSYPQPTQYCERLFELAQEDPDSEEAATALQWISQKDRGQWGSKASALLMEHHMDSEVMADIAMGKAYEAPTVENQDFLAKLAKNSPVERVQGVASYSRVMQLQNGKRGYDFYKAAAESASAAVDDEDQEDAKPQAVEQFENYIAELSDDAKSFYETGETTDGQTIETMMETVNKKFGDVVLTERGDKVVTIGERCESMLFEIRYLAIGKTAPDIEAEDLDGESFKLSDYRGKVVVIDFWGDW